MKWEITHFNCVKSTNRTAISLPVGSVVTADSQTAGHGRYNRTWESPEGNLYLSAVLPDYGEKSPLLAFITGIAVATALSDFDVRLKWPNDVLLNGKKLAGILLERTDDGRVIVGIGVNLTSSPTLNMLYETTHLNGQISIAEITDRILTALNQLLDLFENKGFDIIRHLWLRYAIGIGQPISVHLPNCHMNGIFKELSPDGALVLDTPDGTRQITAGDIFLMKE